MNEDTPHSEKPPELRILLIADPTPAGDRALDRGALLAKSMGARLDIVSQSSDAQDGRTRKGAENGMLPQLSTLRAKGISCDAKFLATSSMSKIAKHVEAVGPDLLVVSGSDRRTSGRQVGPLLTNVLQRRLHCPILVVRCSSDEPYRRVLIATDLSENARHATQVFQRLKIGDQAAVRLFHAYAAPGLNLVMGHVLQDKGRDAYLEGERQYADSRLSAFAESVAYGNAKKILSPIAGRTSDAILEASQSHSIDLIVAGTQGRKGLRKVVLGSVAESLIGKAECDVLVVPPPARRA